MVNTTDTEGQTSVERSPLLGSPTHPYLESPFPISLALVYQGANAKLDPVQLAVYRNQWEVLYDEIGIDYEHDSQRQEERR